MELENLSVMHSNALNKSIVTINSKRKTGYVYRFGQMTKNRYRCCRCRELGKQRCINIIEGTVTGRKDPEADHHPDCEPLALSGVVATELDRSMRSEVRKIFFR